MREDGSMDGGRAGQRWMTPQTLCQSWPWPCPWQWDSSQRVPRVNNLRFLLPAYTIKLQVLPLQGREGEVGWLWGWASASGRVYKLRHQTPEHRSPSSSSFCSWASSSPAAWPSPASMRSRVRRTMTSSWSAWVSELLRAPSWGWAVTASSAQGTQNLRGSEKLRDSCKVTQLVMGEVDSWWAYSFKPLLNACHTHGQPLLLMGHLSKTCPRSHCASGADVIRPPGPEDEMMSGVTTSCLGRGDQGVGAQRSGLTSHSFTQSLSKQGPLTALGTVGGDQRPHSSDCSICSTGCEEPKRQWTWQSCRNLGVLPKCEAVQLSSLRTAPGDQGLLPPGRKRAPRAGSVCPGALGRQEPFWVSYWDWPWRNSDLASPTTV